jgi:lipid-A-disaccharide synthase
MRIGLVAGETSGDALGAGLIRELAKLAPGTRFEGVAGPAMQAAGCEAWESSEVLAMMGTPPFEASQLARATLDRRTP